MPEGSWGYLLFFYFLFLCCVLLVIPSGRVLCFIKNKFKREPFELIIGPDLDYGNNTLDFGGVQHEPLVLKPPFYRFYLRPRQLRLWLWVFTVLVFAINYPIASLIFPDSWILSLAIGLLAVLLFGGVCWYFYYCRSRPVLNDLLSSYLHNWEEWLIGVPAKIKLTSEDREKISKLRELDLTHRQCRYYQKLKVCSCYHAAITEKIRLIFNKAKIIFTSEMFEERMPGYSTGSRHNAEAIFYRAAMNEIFNDEGAYKISSPLPYWVVFWFWPVLVSYLLLYMPIATFLLFSDFSRAEVLSFSESSIIFTMGNSGVNVVYGMVVSGFLWTIVSLIFIASQIKKINNIDWRVTRLERDVLPAQLYETLENFSKVPGNVAGIKYQAAAVLIHTIFLGTYLITLQILK